MTQDSVSEVQKPCGCRYIQPGSSGYWWQMIACPGHPMDCEPLAEVPGDE